MTYWGAPAPGGSKFYLGSSGDTAWNHDILWKARVEKEVAELDPDALEDAPADQDDSSYLAGVNDRTWAPREIEMLRDAVRVHGAGNFSTILSNPQFIALRSHSEQACKEQWRLLEYHRSKSLGATRANWRKTTHSTKCAIESRQREQQLRRQAQSFGRSPSSPNELRASWRGSGQLPMQASGERKAFSLQQTKSRGFGGGGGAKGSPLARSGSQSMKKLNMMMTRASTNAHPELPTMGTIHNLEKTLQKELMVRDQMARTLREGQNQRTSAHLDLLQERKQRRKAEAALQKYQRVLETLANQVGVTQGAPSAADASPLLRKSQSSRRVGSGSRGLSGRSLQTKKEERRQMLKQMLMQAEQGQSTSVAGSPGLLGTKAAGFF